MQAEKRACGNAEREEECPVGWVQSEQERRAWPKIVEVDGATLCRN